MLAGHRPSAPTRTDARRRGGSWHLGAARVIIKGGHLPTADIVDLLYDGHAVHRVPRRARARPAHARHRLHVRRGDRRASRARPLAPEAVPLAQHYVAGAIRHGAGPRPGPRADGPFLASGVVDVRAGCSRSRSLYVEVGHAHAGSGRHRRAARPAGARRPRSARGARTATARSRRSSASCATTTRGAACRFLEYEAYEPLAVRALERIVDEARSAWPGARLGVHHRIGPARDRRGQHHHRRGVGASRRRVRGVPLRDRAREADRADLEARALRRRRRLARGRHGRSRGRGGDGRRRYRIACA